MKPCGSGIFLIPAVVKEREAVLAWRAQVAAFNDTRYFVWVRKAAGSVGGQRACGTLVVEPLNGANTDFSDLGFCTAVDGRFELDMHADTLEALLQRLGATNPPDSGTMADLERNAVAA